MAQRSNGFASGGGMPPDVSRQLDEINDRLDRLEEHCDDLYGAVLRLASELYLAFDKDDRYLRAIWPKSTTSWHVSPETTAGYLNERLPDDLMQDLRARVAGSDQAWTLLAFGFGDELADEAAAFLAEVDD